MHENRFSGFLAQAAPSASGSSSPAPVQGIFGSQIIFLVLVGVMFYFILIRPQQQRTKQQSKMLAALKSGDKVVTSAGLVGTVITVKDKTVTMRSADSKFEVTKASISEVIPEDAGAAAST